MAGAVLVVAAGGTVLGLWLTGPSWPHPWCGQVMSTLYSNGQTYGQFTNALQFEENDGAPTGNLISDENSLAQDEQAESTDNVTQGFQKPCRSPDRHVRGVLRRAGDQHRVRQAGGLAVRQAERPAVELIRAEARPFPAPGQPGLPIRPSGSVSLPPTSTAYPARIRPCASAAGTVTWPARTRCSYLLR